MNKVSFGIFTKSVHIEKIVNWLNIRTMKIIEKILRETGKRVSHLQVCILNVLGSFIMIFVVVFDKSWYWWLLLVLNILFAILNLVGSWKIENLKWNIKEG